MACVNMYNPEGAAAFCGVQPQAQAPVMGPRISFSSDFAVEPTPPTQNRAMSLRCHEEDPDFEFSVGSHPMMAADELFSKGRILPLKDSFIGRRATTLCHELRGGDDDLERVAAKGSSRWKEMLGLRKALCAGGGGVAAAKKSEKGGGDDANMLMGMSPSTQELMR